MVKMHQTTIRFGADLWQALEQEADLLGVSAAQYVRDAALLRLAAGSERPTPAPPPRRAPAVDSVVRHARDEVESSEALWAQGKMAREKAQRLREEALQLRAGGGQRATLLQRGGT